MAIGVGKSSPGWRSVYVGSRDFGIYPNLKIACAVAFAVLDTHPPLRERPRPPMNISIIDKRDIAMELRRCRYLVHVDGRIAGRFPTAKGAQVFISLSSGFREILNP